jgi:hypothetical protein
LDAFPLALLQNKSYTKVICPIVVSPVALMIKPSHLLSVSFLVPIQKVQLTFRSINTDFSFIYFSPPIKKRELELFIGKKMGQVEVFSLVSAEVISVTAYLSPTF